MSAQSKLGRSPAGRLSRLHALQQARCFYCAQTILLRLPGDPPTPQDATIDHFFPKSQGGPDGWRNWVLACRPCNHRKAGRQPSPHEIEAWNSLASAWPYIRPIDPALVEKKRCVVCHRWISPMRLGDSIASGSETETCRPRCGRNTRRARHPDQDLTARELEQQQPTPTQPNPNRPRLTSVLAWLRHWFAPNPQPPNL